MFALRDLPSLYAFLSDPDLPMAGFLAPTSTGCGRKLEVAVTVLVMLEPRYCQSEPVPAPWCEWRP